MNPDELLVTSWQGDDNRLGVWIEMILLCNGKFSSRQSARFNAVIGVTSNENVANLTPRWDMDGLRR